MVPLVTLATRSWPGRSSLPWSRAACLPVRVATARDVRYSSLCCRRSAAVHGRLPEWPKGTVCKTVGSAYDGSNPSPATRCGNGPLAGDSRLGGPFFCVPPCVTLSRCRPLCCGRGSMVEGAGDRGDPGDAEQAVGGGAEGGHDLGAVLGVAGAVVAAVGGVANPVDGLNRPLPPGQRGQGL